MSHQNKYRISNITYAASANLRPFEKENRLIKNKSNRLDLVNSDLIILHGGEDISPTIYGDKCLELTGAKEVLSERDKKELWAIYEAIDNEVPILGICRGAQLLCAVAGGKLFQHVTGHAGGSHNIVTNLGEIFSVTSAHHQMMDLRNTHHNLIAWSETKRSNCYLTPEWDDNKTDNFEPEIEPEIVYFPDIKALAIQGHPEWMDEKKPFIEYYHKLTIDLMEGKL